MKTWPKIIYFNPELKEAIIRCCHNTINEVRASLALITKINENTTAIHVIRVSGTSKSLNKLMEN
jgi:RNase P/RNase MRP subunit POP5